MTRRVAGARDDLEAPDPVARGQADVGRGGQLGPAPGELALHHLLAGVDAGVELGHQHLGGIAELTLELIHRPDVIAVSVGEGDPADRRAGRVGGGDQRLAGARHGRVDQREPVVLADEVGVDEAVAGQLDQSVVERGGLHRGSSGCDS